MFATTLDGFVNIRERNRFGVSLPLISAIGIYVLLITHAQVMLRDPDTFWHIVVGRWIIAHSTVPDHGIFSGTMANAPWLDQEWLAEILIAWGFDHFGWAALAVGTALSVAVATAILLRVLLGVLPPVYAMLAIVLAGALWSPHILARPYILTTPILVAWVAGLVRARSNNRAPSLWLALLIVLWANLHGSFMFGVGIAALLAAEAVLLPPDWSERIRAVRAWGCFGVLALGAALVNPYGFRGLLFSVSYDQYGISDLYWRVAGCQFLADIGGADHGVAFDYPLCHTHTRVATAADSCWHAAPVTNDGAQAYPLHGLAWVGFGVAARSITGIAIEQSSRDQDRPPDGRVSTTG